MKILLFIFGLLVLLIPEVLRIYLIMPFPGSQVSDTIGLAYFLHCYINFFRLAGWIIIAFPLVYWWRKGRTRTKIFSAIPILIYGFIFYVANFIAQADKIFVQPKHKVLATVSENRVNPHDLIIGVNVNGEAKAYPINIIGYHHQIQDTIGGRPVIITYCTVCRSGRAFSPIVNDHYEQFRLVGMDHFNAMFEDKTTGSWWRQENGEAIAGRLKGRFLPEVSSQQMTLQQWIAEHPQTRILQPDSSFANMYAMLKGYDYGLLKNDLEGTNHDSWQMKSWIVGVTTTGGEKAYDWNDLKKQRVINDLISSVPVILILDTDTISFHAFNARVKNESLYFVQSDSLKEMIDTLTHSLWNSKGTCVEGVLSGTQLSPLSAYLEYWHSWKEFHPNTAIYKPSH